MERSFELGKGFVPFGIKEAGLSIPRKLKVLRKRPENARSTVLTQVGLSNFTSQSAMPRKSISARKYGFMAEKEVEVVEVRVVSMEKEEVKTFTYNPKDMWNTLSEKQQKIIRNRIETWISLAHDEESPYNISEDNINKIYDMMVTNLVQKYYKHGFNVQDSFLNINANVREEHWYRCFLKAFNCFVRTSEWRKDLIKLQKTDILPKGGSRNILIPDPLEKQELEKYIGVDMLLCLTCENLDLGYKVGMVYDQEFRWVSLTDLFYNALLLNSKYCIVKLSRTAGGFTVTSIH